MRKAFKDLETVEELKNYLDHSFAYVRKSVFHYTSLDALLCIFTDRRLKFSVFDKTNDVIEEKFVDPGIRNKRYLCFMRTMLENFGMWAMYGGLTKTPSNLKNTYIKIEIPVTELKNLIEEKNLKANLIAYTNLLKTEKKHIYKCGALQNSKNIDLDSAKLSGYIKDNAWEYEKELRIWSNNEYESLKEEFLKSWKIIPSPLISVEECKKLLKTDPRYEAVCSLMNIEENKYFGTYKTR